MSADRATADDHQRASELKNLGMLDASSLRKCYRNLSAEYFAAERKIVELETKLRQEREARQAALTERIAILTAHRACCGTEADPANGKLHGYCVVCGVGWPCEYAGKPEAQVAQLQTTISQLQSALERATKILKAWADNDVVSDDTLMEMTDEVIPMCDAALANITPKPKEHA